MNKRYQTALVVLVLIASVGLVAWSAREPRSRDTARVEDQKGPELLAPKPTAGGTPIEWETSLAKGLKKAAKTGKPVMIDFYADWCSWCRKLDEDTWPDARVQGATADFICVKVNVDKDVESARKYDANSLPTIVFLDSAGEEIHRVEGYQPAADFTRTIALAKAKI